MSTDRENILILLVNYFNEKEVAKFIANQLQIQKNVSFTILITDNGSTKLNELQKLSKNVTVLTPPENLGYLNGAAYAFDHYSKNNAIPRYTILCNTDIRFENEYFFEKLLNDPSNNNADVIGPTVISTVTSHNQNPMYRDRLSVKKIERLLKIYNNYLLYVLYQLGAYIKRWIKKESNKNTEQGSFVYAVHGSFMIFNRSFFEKGNSLHFPAFLYSEELFIAEQCLKSDSKVYYNPNLKVIHSEHSSSGFIKNRKHVEWLKQSLNFIYTSYYK